MTQVIDHTAPTASRAKHHGLVSAMYATVALALALVTLIGDVTAQDAAGNDRAALIQACKADYQRLCNGVKPGGGAILACFQEHGDQLSAPCKTAALQMRRQAASATGSADVTTASVLPLKPGDVRNLTLPTGAYALPAGSKFLANVAYGDDPAQKFDVYLPPAPQNAPIIFMVHGGAWLFGDKSVANVVINKAAHWLPKGYVFISVNNRLVPKADPLVQAEDVALALAKVQAEAAGWNADPTRIVLMGHSAGAHLVTLVASDPTLMAAAGAKPVLGVVPLDSAALNVPAIMEHWHANFYDRAFGQDRAFWLKTSPLYRLTAKPAPMLLICSTRRADSCPPAEEYARKVTSLGGTASVLPEPKTHEEINEQLGLPGAYTEAVDKFLQGLGLN